MGTTTTPNMGMVLPIPGPPGVGEPGPLYAVELVAALTNKVDLHDHNAIGLKLGAGALDIQSTLALNSNILSGMTQAQFSAIASSAALRSVYFVGNELYINDGAGNPPIQLTSGGAVNVSLFGGISGLAATTASCKYVSGSKTFQFWSDTAQTKAALLNCGPISIADTAASAFAISIASPVSLAAAYSWTLPVAQSAPIGSQPANMLSVKSNGQMVYTDADNSSLQVVAGSSPNQVLQVKALGVTNGMLAGSIADSKLATPTATSAPGGKVLVETDATAGTINPNFLPQLTTSVPTFTTATTLVVPSPTDWTASSDFGYWKDAVGMVHFKGFLTWATGGSFGATVFTLGAGYRPITASGAQRKFIVPYFDNTVPNKNAVYVDITIAGVVSFEAVGSSGIGSGCIVWLDGVSFLGEQ